MSDHFNITIQIEIYDKWELELLPEGERIKERLKSVIGYELIKMGYSYDEYFVSG